MAIFTNFRQAKPLIIEVNTSAAEAGRMMQRAHVRFKIVVDTDNNFLGVVSKEELNDQSLIRLASQGIDREDIGLADVMIPKQDLVAFDLEDIKDASIGDIIEALKDQGHQHCLVANPKTRQICGMFSASDISRALHLPLDIQHKSSFIEIAKITKH